MPTRTALRHFLLFLLLPLSVACARESGPEMTAPQALEATRNGKLTLVDIRRPDEWRQTGVAEGALRLDMRHPGGIDGFARTLLNQVGGNKDAPIALICRTGNRTSQMQAALQRLGFTQVYNVREGMAGSGAGPGWLRRGLPVDPCSTC